MSASMPVTFGYLPVVSNAEISTLAQLRSLLRLLITVEFRRRCKNPKARMWWTDVHYANGVVLRGRHKLVGWPVEQGIPFGNLSDVPGGKPVMHYLLSLWVSGTLRFEEADENDIDLARRKPSAVLPGVPPELPAPRCWKRCGRNDMGKARYRPVKNPLRKPLRRRKDGAISPKIIWESDVDDDEDEEVVSDMEE
ncbi:hypothetical protein VTO73DRAFT_4134 [Trametes versicolor]